MLPKNRDQIKKNAVSSFNMIMGIYTKIENAKERSDAAALWEELTKTITIFRRTISKLEATAYDRITLRFNQASTPDMAAVPAFSPPPPPQSSDSTGAGGSPSPPAAVNREDDEMPGLDLDYPPLVKPAQTASEASPKGSSSKTKLDLGEAVRRMPLPIKLRAGEKFKAKVVFVVSPLEFYIIKSEDLTRLVELNTTLTNNYEHLLQNPLSQEDCVLNCACLVSMNNKFFRAIIKGKGAEEVQVYTVDVGRSYFVSLNQLFQLPRTLATLAPPLAHYCTISAVDSRNLDQAAVRQFKEKIVKSTHLTLIAHGTTRRNHGEVVEIEGEHHPLGLFNMEMITNPLNISSQFSTEVKAAELLSKEVPVKSNPIFTSNKASIWQPHSNDKGDFGSWERRCELIEIWHRLPGSDEPQENL